MIREEDLERACCAARAAAPREKVRKSRSRIRSRAAATGGGGAWSFAGRSGAQFFWPRIEDLCLVAAGVRCAVLLDSRRAPRASPPLADVLLALQDQFAAGDGSSCGCDGSHGANLASLGLLRLEDSCFLVNRLMLIQRLADFPCCSSAGPADAAAVATSPPMREAPSTTRGGVRVPGDAVGDVGVTNVAAGLTPEAVNCAPSGSAARQRCLDFALLDVRKSLAAPVKRTDVLAPQLSAALCSTFGVAAANVEAPTSAGPRPGAPPGTYAPMGVATSNHEGGADFGEAPSEGARWLRDWKVKDVGLDSKGLRESLGEVGLPGFAGWLLEYPVIYCCPPALRSEQSDDEGGEWDDGDERNCLGAGALTVYSLRVDFGPRASPLQGESNNYFEAFSFSVPDTVRRPTETETDTGAACGKVEDPDLVVAAELARLVDEFLERFERRIACHSDGRVGCCQRHRAWLHGLCVSKRTETLHRVAL